MTICAIATHSTSTGRWLSWLFAVALLAAVVAFALHFAEAKEFAEIAEHAEPWWLLLAVALQAGTYLAAGQVFRVVARAGGSALGLGAACKLSFAKLFVDQAVPSAGLSGTVVFSNGLERRGLPRPVVSAGIAVDLVSYYVAYVVSLAVALAVAALRGEARPVLFAAALIFSLFATGLSAAAFALAGRRPDAVPRRLARFRVVRTTLDFLGQADRRLARSPRLLALASAWQLAVVLCDAATVWVLVRSLGAGASPTGVFASFMISSLLRTVGVMPGGLGTFEAASVVTLRMVGVPVAVALGATLLFRGLSFWLPMLPGLYYSHREVGPRPAHPPGAGPSFTASAGPH